MNQISFHDQFQVVYPDRKQFKQRMHQASLQIGFDKKIETEKYDSLTGDMVKGVNYSKLNNPVQVFNHHAPRSLFSMLHLLVENSGPEK